jgi:hypothetical protein
MSDIIGIGDIGTKIHVSTRRSPAWLATSADMEWERWPANMLLEKNNSTASSCAPLVPRRVFMVLDGARWNPLTYDLFVWLVADGWCWFVLREKYCWLVAGLF